jgi:hypothetical protein
VVALNGQIDVLVGAHRLDQVDRGVELEAAGALVLLDQ